MGRYGAVVTQRCGRACVSGSFDPLTLGHLDVLLRAADLFDVVHAGGRGEPGKRGLFTGPSGPSSSAGPWRTPGTRGPRAWSWRSSGTACSSTTAAPRCRWSSRACAAGRLRLRTADGPDEPPPRRRRDVFLVGDPAYGHVSSSLVKEVARYGGDVSGLVPAARCVRLWPPGWGRCVRPGLTAGAVIWGGSCCGGAREARRARRARVGCAGRPAVVVGGGRPRAAASPRRRTSGGCCPPRCSRPVTCSPSATRSSRPLASTRPSCSPKRGPARRSSWTPRP